MHPAIRLKEEIFRANDRNKSDITVLQLCRLRYGAVLRPNVFISLKFSETLAYVPIIGEWPYVNATKDIADNGELVLVPKANPTSAMSSH